VRRAFWAALGLGAGATAAVLASRWMKRQTQKVAPAAIGRQAKSGLQDLTHLWRESMAAGREAARSRETEFRSSLEG
jgi:hypothetical protein